MAFDLAAARKAGYTDAEIASHLARRFNFDLDGAKKAGYADSEVIASLAAKASMPGQTTPTAQQEPGIIDKAIGAGEAALSTVTGVVGGTLGMAGGLAGGIAGAIASGKIGTQEGARMVDEAAAEGAAKLTYQPRTETGQQYTQAIGQAMQQALPAMAVLPSMGPAVAAMQPAGALARTSAAAVLDKAATGAKALPGKVAQAMGKSEPAPTPGTLPSVGGAGADVATQRIATAQSLPEPISLTKGQATRDFEQLRFEGETAKNPSLGQPLRERAATQNAALAKNFEALIDESGAQAASAIETGRAVDRALVRAAAAKKAEYRSKYNAAEKAGEMSDPVDLGPVAEYLNQNRAGRSSAPILGTIAEELSVQRIGGGSLADGSVQAGAATLKQAEALRKAVNRFVKDNDPNDVRVAVDLKKIIDAQTEGVGGSLYKEARAARQRYAQLFEDNAIVSDLLRTRRGTADRQVAMEDVFRRTILNGDRESVGNLRRTLQVAGGEEGAQAWRELQGATVRHLLDEATKGVGTDTAGNPIVSAAKLNNAVRALDVDGRLDFVLTKKGAQTIRDLNEISKVVLTLPPGAVNTSNTASVLLSAIADAGVTGSLTGLPVPILTGLRALAMHVKDQRIRQRVQEALRQESARKKSTPVVPANKTFH